MLKPALGRAAIIFFCFVLVSTRVGWAQQHTNLPSAGTPSPSPAPTALQDLSQSSVDVIVRFLNLWVVLFGANRINPTAQIRRIVQDPRTLNAETQARAHTFVIRTNALLAEWMLTDIGQRLNTPYQDAATQSNLSLTLTPERSTELVNRLLLALSSHFTTEQLIDLSVYGLSQRFNWFQSASSWNRTSEQLGRYSGLVALGALGVLSLADAGALSVGGSIWRPANRPDRRLGFRVGVRSFGISGSPQFRTALTYLQRRIEVSLSINARVSAPAPNDTLGIEALVRSTLAQVVTRHFHLDVNYSGLVRFAALNENPALQGHFYTQQELFINGGINRGLYYRSRQPATRYLLDAWTRFEYFLNPRVVIDSAGNRSVSVGIGAQSVDSRFFSQLRVGDSTGQEPSLSVFLGGELESDFRLYSNRERAGQARRSACRHVLQAHRYLVEHWSIPNDVTGYIGALDAAVAEFQVSSSGADFQSCIACDEFRFLFDAPRWTPFLTNLKSVCAM